MVDPLKVVVCHFAFGPSSCSQISLERLALPRHGMRGECPVRVPATGDACDSLCVRRGVLSSGGRTRTPALAHPSRRSPRASAACGDACRSLRWLTIFGVAIETAGIEKHFARLGKERLRPHALIPNVRKLGGRRSVATCAIASRDTDPKATVARPPNKVTASAPRPTLLSELPKLASCSRHHDGGTIYFFDVPSSCRKKLSL